MSRAEFRSHFEIFGAPVDIDCVAVNPGGVVVLDADCEHDVFSIYVDVGEPGQVTILDGSKLLRYANDDCELNFDGRCYRLIEELIVEAPAGSYCTVVYRHPPECEPV